MSVKHVVEGVFSTQNAEFMRHFYYKLTPDRVSKAGNKHGDFVVILIFYVFYSTLLHLPPLRFHCVEGCWDRNRPRLLRLWHWQSDALANRLEKAEIFLVLQ
jgi:hypothetical protein